MILKFKSIFIICVLISCLLIGNLSLNLNAKNLDNVINDTSTTRSNGYPRAGSFDCSAIEVLSEPIFGKDFNTYGSGSPRIAVENDKIYVVWADNNDTNGAGSGDLDIFFRYFDGSSWSKIQVVSEPVPGLNSNTWSSYSPDIAVENGKIYVVWKDGFNVDGASGDYDILFRCNLTGTRWEDMQAISEPVKGKNFNVGDSRAPSIDVENDKIYICWSDDNNTNSALSDYDIFYRCNLTGNSWEDIQVISEPIQGQNFNTGESGYYDGPEITVESGSIYIVWTDKNNTNNADVDRDIFYRCNSTGFFWEPIQVISEPVQDNNYSSGNSKEPSIAVNNGNIHIVWNDNNNTNNAGTDTDIFYRCNLTGNGWEEIQVISEPVVDQNFNIGWSGEPEITVEDDIIYVVWYDNYNTNGAGQDGDIFYRYNFKSTCWEDIQVISEPVVGKNFNVESSIKPHIAVNRWESHIAWVDNNLSNNAGLDSDIFYRSISLTFGLASPDITPVEGNTSTNFNFTVTYFHFDNKSPIEITANIDDIQYSMSEVNPIDTNFLDGKDYFFNIKNLDLGVHKYQFYTSDGLKSISSKIYNEPIVYNSLPRIITKNNLTAFEDTYYKVDYDYEDIDNANIGQFVSFSNFSTNALWLNFEYNTGVLSGTPSNDDVGEYWINISINDTIVTDFTNFTLTVINVNDAPNIVTNDIKIAIEDELYEVVYKAIDIDTPQNDLIWTMNSNSTWLGFEHSIAKLHGTPGNDDVGEYWVSISVSDNEYINYSNFTLQVTNVNDPPRIITKNNITALEDEFYEMIYKAEDVDNTQNELFWDINTDAKWLNYDTQNAVINGTPTNDNIGEYWVNISVNDTEFTDFSNFTLTVVNTNDPPMITTEDKTEVTVGELFSVNYEAQDLDPPPITLTWSIKTNASDWLTIDTYNGWLNGIPSVNDVGIYWVNVTVTDGDLGWDFHNFTLEVFREPIRKNIAPELFNASMKPLNGNTKTEFTFSVHYYDEDGDAPVFIEILIDGEDHNMKLKLGEIAYNGIYEYRTTLSKGVHNYYFIAFDGLETVKTDNSTTPEIKSTKGISQERTSWYWLIWIVIIVIIIASLMFLVLFKKRKAAEIPTVKAELLHAPPKPLALPSVTPSVKGAELLAPQPIASEQLPTPTMQVQPSGEIPSEKVSVPSLAPAPIQPQYQLPKATLTKAQELHLLRERFLKGEVTEETYNKLRAEIEAQTEEDITKDDTEELPTISDQQQSEAIEQSISIEATSTSTPEHVGKPPQQLPTEPEITQPQSITQTQQQEKLSLKEINDEENND